MPEAEFPTGQVEAEEVLGKPHHIGRKRHREEI